MYRTHIPLTIKNPLGHPPPTGVVSHARQHSEGEDELLEPDVLLLELLLQYSPFLQSELGHQEQTVFLSGLLSLGVSNILTENPRLSR
jgi:hypothetical protein